MICESTLKKQKKQPVECPLCLSTAPENEASVSTLFRDVEKGDNLKIKHYWDATPLLEVQLSSGPNSKVKVEPGRLSHIERNSFKNKEGRNPPVNSLVVIRYPAKQTMKGGEWDPKVEEMHLQ